jgi:hypothetical protein
VQISIEA